VTFREAIEHAAQTGITSENALGEDSVELLLNNGDILIFKSNYDRAPSNTTPGNGIDPPSVELLRRR